MIQPLLLVGLATEDQVSWALLNMVGKDANGWVFVVNAAGDIFVRVGIGGDVIDFFDTSVTHVDLACRIAVSGTFEVDEHLANEQAPDFFGMAMLDFNQPALKKTILSHF